jgi:hypothetical protein
MKKKYPGLIVVFSTVAAFAEVMSFTDNFEGYATGDLQNASTNWVAGPWSVDFDVIDHSGDKKVRHNDGNRYAIVPVASSVFSLSSGQDLTLVNKFTSSDVNWLHGVVLNYTQSGSVYDMYTVYLTRTGASNRDIMLNIDKWDDSSGTGSQITSLLSVDTGDGNWGDLNGNGTMTVTYDASEDRIGVQVTIDTGFSISTNIVDSSFDIGQVGLFGRSAEDYVVNEFSVSSIPEPATLGLVGMTAGLALLLRRIRI